MSGYRRGGYMRAGDDGVERECDLCEWYAVADTYPELIGAYQSHLRAKHPRAWLRA